jgi:hypothetical protein
MNMNASWTIQSSTNSTKALAVFFGALGLLFLWLISRARPVPGQESELMAAFWLGVLLLVVACWVFLFLEHVFIVVDERLKVLRVSRTSLTGTRSSIHHFNSIEGVEVASTGRSHRGIVTYHLNIVMKDGKPIKTQFWSTSHDEVTELAERFAQTTGSFLGSKSRNNPSELNMFLISGAGAVLIYCVWYNLTVGSFCLAMWFGTAPAVIIGVAFLSIFRICRQLPQL